MDYVKCRLFSTGPTVYK